MAIYRLVVTPYTSHTARHGIAPHARYIGREEGAAAQHQSPDKGGQIEAKLLHKFRQRPEEKLRTDLVEAGHLHMPSWAQADPLRYWQAADQYTRRGGFERAGLYGKEILLTLPMGVSREENRALLHQFLATLPKNLPMSYALHAPMNRAKTGEQPHAHILVSLKEDDGGERTPVQWFRNAPHGARVSTFLATSESIRQIREQGYRLVHAFCQDRGITVERSRPDLKEPRLPWQEMDAVDKLIRKHQPKKDGERWVGHEYRIPATTLRHWYITGQVNSDQYRWLIQRSRRQVAQQLTRTQQQQRSLPAWRFLAYQAMSRKVTQLGQQQHALTALATRYVTPALQRQQQRQYQRQMQAQARRLGQARGQSGQAHQPHGPGWHWDLGGEHEQRQAHTHARGYTL